MDKHPGILLLITPVWLALIIFSSVHTMPLFVFSPSERRFFRLVTKIDDVRMIPILLSGRCNTRGHMLETDINEALIRLLPQLSDGADMTIKSDQRRCLHFLARGGTPKRRVPTELLCAALHALPILGDASSIPVVQSLVDRSSPVWVLTPEEDEAARRCLEALMAKFGSVKGSDTLLRPSQRSPLVASTELLRPVDEQATHDPDQMLRPSEQERSF